MIWLRTPKCAGTSLKILLKQHNLINRKVTIVLSDHKEEFINKHETYYNNSFKFCIVRNPYDKFISAWKYLELTKHWTLEKTIENLPTKEQHYKAYHHITRTQTECISNKAGNINVNKIIKFEEFEKEIKDLFKTKLNINNIEIPHENKSERTNYIDYFNKHTIQKINELYCVDFKNFNYEMIK